MAPLTQTSSIPFLDTEASEDRNKYHHHHQQQHHHHHHGRRASNRNNNASPSPMGKIQQLLNMNNNEHKNDITSIPTTSSATTETLSATETKSTPILVEIIGATNLTHPPSTRTKPTMKKPLHPFVVAKLHKRGTTEILTKTKRIKNNSDPIWCVEHRCLFLVHVNDDMVMNSSSSSSRNIDPTVLPCYLELNIRHKTIHDPLSTSVSSPSSTQHLYSSIIDIDQLWDYCNNQSEERIELQLERQSSKLGLKREDTASSKTNFDGVVVKKKRVMFCNDNDDDSDDEKEEEEEEDLIECKIAIRTRFASDLDVKLMKELNYMYLNGKYSSFYCDTQSFMNDIQHNDNHHQHQHHQQINTNNHCNKNIEFITEKSQQSVGYTGVINMFNSPFRNSVKNENGILQYKVKPYPDPNRKKETTYLSHEEMEDEMMKPSKNWIAAGKETSQSLGQVYLEILKCSNLPNMDTGEALGNKTDAFVCAIYEESMVQTDVIDDKLSPFWFPWCQRAFVFQMTHASSPLFISVFDYDMGPGGHDGIGRIAINLSKFKADTLYTLEYNVYPASNVTDRETLGTITVRLRKEIKDEKKLLLQSLEPAPRFHVNMKKRMSLPVANYTCFGAHNEEKFDLTLMRSYVNEMLEMKRFLKFAINDAISSLVMWRGQVKVGRYVLPLHSALAFFGGIYVVERPHMIPGCFFLSIAWVMLASLNSRTHHPSPWQRTLPFSHYLSILLLGKSYVPTDEIRPMQGHKESCRFVANWDTRIKTDIKTVNKAWELQLEMEKIGNENLQTEEKESKDPIEIAKATMSPWLFPMQMRLRTYCGYMREIKKVVTWEDGMQSFWITLPCIVIGVALLILPAVFLIHWFFRLFIWVCLGPWIRIYSEVFVVEHDNNKSLKYNEKKMITEQFQEARSKGEDAMKMKSMRTMRFGAFIARVPPTYTTRHYDFPISQSKASHISNYPDHQLSSDVTMTFIPSQRLQGNMIPLTEEQMATIHHKSKKDLDQNADNTNAAVEEDIPTKTISKSTIDKSDNNVEAQNWLDTTLNQLASLTYQGRSKLTHTSSSDTDEVKDKIHIDDKVLHISAEKLICNEHVGGSFDKDDKSELSNLTDHDFDNDEEKDEEGLEVVAWEQSAVSVKLNGEDIDLDDESIQGTESSSLSAIYKSSDDVYMAFCRTPTSKCE